MPQSDYWVTTPPTRSGLPLRRFHCVDCNFGASRRTEPARCPMCGGKTWVEDAWEPWETSEAESLALLPGVPLS
jgi:hypothetical protein